MKLTKLFVMLCFLAAPLSAAQTLSYNLDAVTEVNVDAPTGTAPWATVAFNDLGLNQVEFLLTLDLTGDEFMSGFSFNLDPALSVNSLTFSNTATVGAFTLPSITRSTNGVNEGQGMKFDFGVDFSTSNASSGSRRFNNTDSLRYVMSYTGSGTFNSQSFKYLDATGTNYVIAHVQGIGECDTSAWITGTPSIPEPQPAMLLGAFGIIALLRRRK